MSWRYLKSKGLGVRGHVPKTTREKFLSTSQVEALLKSCEASKAEFNADWYRDYAAIYLGYMVGGRIGEVRLLERRNFSDLASQGIVRIPTLKQAARIPITCPECEKRMRVSVQRVGMAFKCPRCGVPIQVAEPHKPVPRGVPENELPFMETQVKEFLLEYLEGMRPDQNYLFEGRGGKPVSTGFLSRIFNTHARRAGLSNKYSFHSLRHGRATKVYSLFKNAVTTIEALRQKSMRMVAVYGHMDEEDKKTTREALENKALRPITRKRV